MSSVVISGDTSGNITVSAPAVAGSNTLTLQAATATNAVNTLGTAVASTSGTSIDFTGLPSWIKRITVMFNGVSTSGTSQYLVQIGSGSTTITGYVSASSRTSGGATAYTTYTAGFGWNSQTAAEVNSGHMSLTNISGNIWVSSHAGNSTVCTLSGGGVITLGGTLDRIRITTVNGTDTFDAGSVNILYEG